MNKNTLIATIHSLTEEFAGNLNEAIDKLNAIVGVLGESSLSELALGESGAGRSVARTTRAASKPAGRKAGKAGKAVKSGRLARRSPEQITIAIEQVARLLVKHPDGLRSEQIRDKLGLDKREVPRLLQQGVADGAFKILHGEKRATTYGAGKGRKPKAKAAAKKTAKKPAKKTAKKARKAKKPVKRMAPKKAASAKKPSKAKPSKKAKAATNHMAAAATPA